jgi:hypothetical protein
MQSLQSFAADDKSVCAYLAEREAAVHEHARSREQQGVLGG